jgi:hypothetical protein
VTLKANPATVDFDYDGALSLARQFWSLADLVDQTSSSRQGLAAGAKVGFSGQYAGQFTQRMTVEAANAASVSQALRDAATQCAEVWAGARNEESRRRYAHHVDELKAHRSVVQTIWDGAFGFPFPPPPDPVTLPQPPAFAPTTELVCS